MVELYKILVGIKKYLNKILSVEQVLIIVRSSCSYSYQTIAHNVYLYDTNIQCVTGNDWNDCVWRHVWRQTDTVPRNDLSKGKHLSKRVHKVSTCSSCSTNSADEHCMCQNGKTTQRILRSNISFRNRDNQKRSYS